MKINLGGGMKKIKGWTNIDIRPFPQVDFVLDIEKEPIPFKNNKVDEILSDHVFEHLTPNGLFYCIEECFRVLKPTGFLHINVPKAMTPAYYIHPDHKIGFLEDTFGFFQVPGNPEHKDPHGYLKGFWHVNIIPQNGTQCIEVKMFPNKKNGRYDYVKVTR